MAKALRLPPSPVPLKWLASVRALWEAGGGDSGASSDYTLSAKSGKRKGKWTWSWAQLEMRNSPANGASSFLVKPRLTIF